MNEPAQGSATFGADRGTRRILLVEDHPLMRMGLSQAISRESGLEVVCEASTEREALDRIPECRPDIVVVDLTLREGSGLSLIREIKVRHREVPVLVLSMHDEAFYAERALHAGARGYIMKEQPAPELIKAIRRVLEGRIYLSDRMSEKVLEKASSGTLAATQESPIESLSDRELQVFRLVGRGLRPREIAEQLNLSVKTVEVYAARIKQKLGLSSASELAQYAIQWSKDEDSLA